MAKDTLEKETEETEVLEIEETETPTQKPELLALQGELSKLQAELDQTKKGLSTAHQTLTRKDEEIKRKANLENRIDGLQDTIELLATAIAGRGETQDIDLDRKDDILTELKKRRSEADAKAKRQEIQDAQQDYQQKADGVYARARIAFGDDDDAIERIEDMLMNGRLERAEARVAKAEQKVSAPKNKETEDERIDRLAEERFRRHLEEKGLLETYGVTPGSSGGSTTDVMKMYVEGKITADEAQKRGVTF